MFRDFYYYYFFRRLWSGIFWFWVQVYLQQHKLFKQHWLRTELWTLHQWMLQQLVWAVLPRYVAAHKGSICACRFFFSFFIFSQWILTWYCYIEHSFKVLILQHFTLIFCLHIYPINTYLMHTFFIVSTLAFFSK